MEFPVTLRDIAKFEKQNPYAINVYGYESGVNVLRISKRRDVTVINLLLLYNSETNHYCWIKNLSRIISPHKSININPLYTSAIDVLIHSSHNPHWTSI